MLMLKPKKSTGEHDFPFGKVLLRPPCAKDAPALADFANSLVREKAYILLTKEVSREEEENYLRNALYEVSSGMRLHLLAVCNEKVIGACEVRRGIGSASHTGLLAVSVRKGYRGSGVGTLILKRIIGLSAKAGLKVIHLWVIKENKQAIRFYRKLGFFESGTLPRANRYGGKYMDSSLMVRTL